MTSPRREHVPFVCRDTSAFVADDEHLKRNKRRTFWVVVLTATMMVAEIIAGYLTGSMALLADGYHMASHAAALSIALLAYRFATSEKLAGRFSFGAGKVIPLGGYTSAIMLAMIALWMAVESLLRLYQPQEIRFNEAIGIAFLGLLVNIVSAMILGHGHTHPEIERHDHGHDHGHSHSAAVPMVHDHNLRGAYLHVLADAVTSVAAILALLLGKFFNWVWMDALMGIVGSVVILRWAYRLCVDTGLELLDAHTPAVDVQGLKTLLEVHGGHVLDLHLWRVAPKAVACELIVASKVCQGAQFYRDLILKQFAIQHLVIEERCP